MPPRQDPIAPPQSASVLQGYPQLHRQVRPNTGLRPEGVSSVTSALHTPPSERSKIETSRVPGACPQAAWVGKTVPIEVCAATFPAGAAPPEAGTLRASRSVTITRHNPSALTKFLIRSIARSSLLVGRRRMRVIVRVRTGTMPARSRTSRGGARLEPAVRSDDAALPQLQAGARRGSR